MLSSVAMATVTVQYTLGSPSQLVLPKTALPSRPSGPFQVYRSSNHKFLPHIIRAVCVTPEGGLCEAPGALR